MTPLLRKNGVLSLLRKIRSILKGRAHPNAKAAFQKLVPTSQNVYGVRMPVLNELARQYMAGGFELVEGLWSAATFEERMLSAKILGKVCKNDPERSLALLLKFSNEISDWAICDTIATQGIRGIVKSRRREVFNLSRRFVRSELMWQRRLGIVLLTNYAKEDSLKKEIQEIIRH
jgi:3-methyladenine DNA glycosylase AlkD